jgi:hypothetical protein
VRRRSPTRAAASTTGEPRPDCEATSSSSSPPRAHAAWRWPR